MLDLNGDARHGNPAQRANVWKNARLRLVIKRACQRQKLKPITIVFAFDETGKKIDLKKSKLS
jgi:hypothetical protein